MRLRLCSGCSSAGLSPGASQRSFAIAYFYTGIFIPMPRKKLQEADFARAERLGALLNERKTDKKVSVQDLASASKVGYETIRSLLKGSNANPGFFSVADLAKELKLDLGKLAEKSE
ncbi:MAG: hypothetical protein F4Y12_06575 [Acidimicrobiaceae bacterium]|nr:hypothetical protein [Acidimicrobiaceae bacterium]